MNVMVIFICNIDVFISLCLTKTCCIFYINIVCNKPFNTIMNTVLKTYFNQILPLLPWVLMIKFYVLCSNVICGFKTYYKIYV